MKATPLIINWHDQNSPIYSAHFEPHGKERLATGGGDNNVRVWKVTGEGEDRQAEYLSTLTKHTQAVNVVRWAPKGEILASAGDDGNVILWVPSETHHPTFGNEGLEDKETWRAKHMFRQTGSEIYDLAWSPDASYFIIGSMDNVARIYNAGTGSLIRQIAEHSHYVQGVTWDPLNEYIATQSSDRSVHIYSLKTKDGQYTLNSHDEKTTKIASHHKMDLPPRRISAGSPAPPELSGYRSQLAGAGDTPSVSLGSPVPSQPGTPQSVALPMNPPSVVSHSRRSSFSSRRSMSPAPSLPLPAVMPLEPSPKPSHSHSFSGVKNASLYANETLTSFFRRLCFTPDGSLLLTPAGQYSAHQAGGETGRSSYDLINTVYVYTRGGINKPPIAHLPGHKKPSVAIRCSPVLYTLRTSAPTTRNITIDTSSAEDAILPLPEPLSKPSSAVMDPPPPPTSAATTEPERAAMPAKASSAESAQTKPAFTLPYRMIYAVATQDAVLLYDTQQMTPLCIVSNLHLATFTDLTWSSDGLTLLISSSDGFCSTLTFTPGELGQAYTGELAVAKPSTTPVPSSAAIFASPSPRPNHQHRNSATSFTAPSPPATGGARPPSPTRSSSASSVATQSGPPLISGAVPSIAATNSAKVTGLPLTTPPETPATGAPVVAGVKRDASESEKEEPSDLQPKKRRVVPTPVPDPRV